MMVKKQVWISVYYSVLLLMLSIGFCNAADAAIIGGDPKGKITIVEFFDYQCPHCRRMAVIIDQLVSRNSDVRVVYKATPVLNQTSWLLARAVTAAQYQEDSSVFHHLLLSPVSIHGEKQLFYLTKKAGLNPQLLINTLYAPAVTKELQHNLANLEAMQVAGVPIFIMGYTSASKPTFLFSGEISLPTLQHAINQLHEK